MRDPEDLLRLVGVVVVAGPSLAVAVLGISSLVDRKISEEATTRLLQAAVISGLIAAVMMLTSMLITGTRHVAIDLGYWVAIPRHYHFSVKLVFDRLSVPMAILSFTLAGTIGAFASKYLHREPGFNRFFVLYALFVLGMIVASLAGTVETLFAGWELVGLSSALLVAFFQERPGPARNGLWVWTVYRVSDAALLLAAVAMHHLGGEGDFDAVLGPGAWPFYERPLLPPTQALIVGLLFMAAAAGKSALVPFSGWLPRAMEGPTPSSAVFYGALSVHLGTFLLLRVAPILDTFPLLPPIIVVLGLSTAVLAYLAGSVQSDIKGALSFASLSQVGLIVAEIGLGLRYVALVHLLGHACLRTLQFVRAPALLQDYNVIENAIGERLPSPETPWRRLPARRASAWLYRLGLQQGIDGFLSDHVVGPFVRLMRRCDRLERRWSEFLAGGAPSEPDEVTTHIATIDEFS